MLHLNTDINAVLNALMHPALPVISMGLERVEALLAHLGNLQQRLPPVVHVAGTNGKGSVIAYLRAACEAAGLRVHSYTSPHLVRFNERIQLADGVISDAALYPLLLRVQAAAEQVPTTFFEATTAAALLAFAEHPADIVLLETGMGGRLDATNVVAAPLLTIITPISMDHTEFLGETLAAIAHEKAGIIKPQVPCVVGLQKPAAMAVIQARAAELAAPLVTAADGWCWQHEGAAEWRYIGADGVVMLLANPALVGQHQYDNAALAAQAMLRLAVHFGWALDAVAAALATAMRTVQWPARLQPMPALSASLPSGSAVWLDGGHNASAGRAIGAWLHAQSKADARPVWLVWGMLHSKDAAGYVLPIAPELKGVVAVPVAAGESMPAHAPQHLADVAVQCHVPLALIAADVAVALAAIRTQSHGAPVRVLIGGSLYLAGAVLATAGQ